MLRELFADDFDENAVGEFAFDEVDHAVFDQAFEDLAGGLRRWCLFLRRSRTILRLTVRSRIA